MLALGPLSQLAAAIEERPELKTAIAGSSSPGIRPTEKAGIWRRSEGGQGASARRGRPPVRGCPRNGNKAAVWQGGSQAEWRSTSLGDFFLDRLMAEPDAREHYLVTRDQLYDELAMLFLLEPGLFQASGSGDVFSPLPGADVGDRVAELIHRGRQRKRRVIFTDQPVPATMLQPDVRARRAGILAANGEDEWFAQLLLNELHEHLGAYSIIGVKMGLRAAEMLNAPQHAMAIALARTADPTRELPQRRPAGRHRLDTGAQSIPARAGTARHGSRHRSPSIGGRSPCASRRPTGHQIRDRIGQLRRAYDLSDDGYWEGVRKFGLDIWEDWHRLDLFEVADLDDLGPDSDETE